MPLVQLTAVVEGKDLDPRRLATSITRALRVEADEIDKMYKRFYATWSQKPSMIKKVSTTGADAYAEVSTRGRTDHRGNKSLLFLDDGTRVRWATVSRNWQSKTRPGGMSAGPGAGRVTAKGKKATYNRRKGRPGIKARNISEKIAAFRNITLHLAVQAAVDDATK